MKRIAKFGLVAAVALFGLAQLVPYGRDHANPPVTQAAKFASPHGEALMREKCADCHSNLTTWRWYSNVAPASWLVANDVSGARKRLNFSEWNKSQPPLDELVRQIKSGGMPPLQYRVPHPSARMSSKDKQDLIDALTALYKKDPPSIRADRGGD